MIPKLKDLDPRAKMMMLLCLSTTALLLTNLLLLFLLLVFTLFILGAGGVSFDEIRKQTKSAVNFVVFLFLLQCVFNRKGEALVSVYGFTLFTDKGVLTAAMLSLRLLIFLLSALILLTGEPRDYLLAMVQCRIPYEIAFMVMVGIHFFPILKEEGYNVYYSAQLRGTEIQKANLKDRLSAYGKLCLPILVAALERAKAMSIAMESKCFRAFPRRTYMRKLKLKTIDKLYLALFPLGMSLLLFFFYCGSPVLSFGEEALPKGDPTEIILTWTGDPKHTQTISWSTTVDMEEYIEYISAEVFEKASDKDAAFSKSTKSKAVQTVMKENEYYRYEATLTGLLSGTEYYYRVGNGTVWNKPQSFFTEKESISDVHFLFLGDVQFELREDYAVWGKFLQNAYKNNPETAFAIMGGDYVNSSGNQNDWQCFLGEATAVFSEIPMMTVPGNHETSILPAFYLKMFALPKTSIAASEEFYSFDYGNCHFLALNSCVFMPERKNKLGEAAWNKLIAQTNDWIEKDISKSKAKWNIVFLHHPPYPVSEDDPIYALIRKNWEPLFSRGKVDAVFCGHQHVTMRTQKIAGVTYFMGNSGIKRSRYYDGKNAPDYSAFLDQENSTYQMIDADENSLTIKTFAENNEVLDTILIQKEDRIKEVFR